jgi:hypothetical protein
LQTETINWLLTHLPRPPAQILVIGKEVDALVSALTPYQVTFAHFLEQADKLQLKTVNCLNSQEEKVLNLNNYTAVVLCIPIQLTHLLTLLHQIYQLLSEVGQLFLISTMDLQKNAENTDKTPPLITYVIAHAQRCGFQLKQQVEFADCPDKQPHLMGLEWIKTLPPRWRITTVTSQEKDHIIALFNQVFQPNQMSTALWEWKYGQGRGLGILAWQNQQLIAHYGGILREIRYLGQPKTAVQITDVMVAVKERAVFTRQGAFFLVTTTFLENYVGYGTPVWVAYGFPSERHVKLAEHLGLYARVGKMKELRWPVITAKPEIWVKIRHLQPQQYFKKQKLINQLWEKMAVSLRQALVGVRNSAYLYHRYLCHPHKQYELLLISRRFTGQALAFVVVYREDDLCKIMDYIGDIKWLPIAIYQVRRFAGHWGLRQVQVWITQNFITAFPLESAEQHDLGIYIPHNTWSNTFPPNQIENQWWLMAGDTDFL